MNTWFYYLLECITLLPLSIKTTFAHFQLNSILYCSLEEYWSQLYQDLNAVRDALLLPSVPWAEHSSLLSCGFLFPARNWSWLVKIETVLELSNSAFSVIFNMALLTHRAVLDTQQVLNKCWKTNKSSSRRLIPFLFFSYPKALLFKKQSEDQPLWHHLGAVINAESQAPPAESESAFWQDLQMVCVCVEFWEALL